MTQKTFNILDFCTTWVESSKYGIFQDNFLSTYLDDIPEESDESYSGMWLYYIASQNRLFFNIGYVADDVIQIGSKRFVYLYRLE